MAKEPKEKKQDSIKEEILEESFIIGCSIALGYSLKLERKVKEDEKLQRVNIVEVENENITNEINGRMKRWENERKGDSKEDFKIEQRDIDKTKQNITYNVLMENMSQHNLRIEYKSVRLAKKIVSRKRILTFNGLDINVVRRIGEHINYYLIKIIPTEPKKTRRECQRMVSFEDLGEVIFVGSIPVVASLQSLEYRNNGSVFYCCCLFYRTPCGQLLLLEH